MIIPDQFLNNGENMIELISYDCKDFIVIDNIEKIKKLDRMANGAGFIYQYLTLSKHHILESGVIKKLQVKPSVIYKKNSDGDLVEKCDIFMEFNQPIVDSELSLHISL